MVTTSFNEKELLKNIEKSYTQMEKDEFVTVYKRIEEYLNTQMQVRENLVNRSC